MSNPLETPSQYEVSFEVAEQANLYIGDELLASTDPALLVEPISEELLDTAVRERLINQAIATTEQRRRHLKMSEIVKFGSAAVAFAALDSGTIYEAIRSNNNATKSLLAGAALVQAVLGLSFGALTKDAILNKCLLNHTNEKRLIVLQSRLDESPKQVATEPVVA